MAKSIEYNIMRLHKESPIHLYIDLWDEETMSSIDMNLKFINIIKCNIMHAYLETQINNTVSVNEILSLYERIQLARE